MVAKIYSDSFYDYVGSRAENAARETLTLLSHFIAPTRIVDVGCGPGIWTLEAAKQFPNSMIDGFDFEINRNITSESMKESKLNFHVVDFEENDIGIMGVADLFVFLEVAEHLQEETALKLLDYMCRHGKAVLFSAANKGQGGTHHINEQHIDYWSDVFFTRGFLAFDVVRSHLLSKNDIPNFYQNNIVLFLQKDQLNKSSEFLNKGNLLALIGGRYPEDIRSSKLRIVHFMMSLLPPVIITGLAKIKGRLNK